MTSSGTTVHGSFTEFMSQLSPGDAIIITHPTTYDYYRSSLYNLADHVVVEFAQTAAGNESSAYGPIQRQHRH